MKTYAILINGQKAVSSGYAFCAGKCYRKICGGLGQVEVVVDEETEYNGIPQKWVSVSYIATGRDIPVILDALRDSGFSGCPCIVAEDEEIGCFAKQTELFCTVV